MADEYGFRGQLSNSVVLDDFKSDKIKLGIRYIPEISYNRSLSDDYFFDAEISMNAYGYTAMDFEDLQKDASPYRVWVRFSTNQFEARAGLQKINFGSATMLRPLMWFDQIDPRDPLQITNGVYGVLLRYYFLNNSNFWVWGLYGEDEAKGLEFLPSVDGSLEMGGRFQYPVFKGELAATFHRRKFDAEKNPFSLLPGQNNGYENRYALDGKWDVGVGLWFEAAILKKDLPVEELRQQNLFNFGSDYTFACGNGVHVLGEYFFYKISKNLSPIKVGALLMDYNLNMFDQLMGIVYWDTEHNDFYRYVGWRRTYDRWSFNLQSFWNPDTNNLYNFASRNTEQQFSGKGLLFMLIYNH
jgi:hypothetical protein